MSAEHTENQEGSRDLGLVEKGPFQIELGDPVKREFVDLGPRGSRIKRAIARLRRKPVERLVITKTTYELEDAPPELLEALQSTPEDSTSESQSE